MRNSAYEAQDGDRQREALLHLTLEGLLPANQTLAVNPAMRAATLISQTPEGEAQIVAQQHFSPNGMRILVPLLQAYPHYCPYEVLLASLFSLSLEEARRQLRDIWEIAIRSVRRAVGSLIAQLRALGLQVRSIRGAGYLVEALSREHA